MQQRVYSRLALCTFFQSPTCAEGWIVREWTCWKPRSKTHDRTASGRPSTIQWTLYNTTCGRAAPLRELMPFLTSAWQAPFVHDDAQCRKEERGIRGPCQCK